MQNAADAAVVAGAKQLHYDEQSLSDYIHSTFVNNWDQGFRELIKTQTISKRATGDGDKVAKQYIKKNLSKNDASDDAIIDSWNNNAEVKFKSALYGTDSDDYEALYYVITLEEPLQHLFSVMDNFGFAQMNAKVIAVAKIHHVNTFVPVEPITEGGEKVYRHGPSLYDQMVEVRDRETYSDWDAIKAEKKKNLIPDKLAEKKTDATTLTNAAKEKQKKIDALKTEREQGKNTYTDEEIEAFGDQAAENYIIAQAESAADSSAKTEADERSILTAGAYYKAGRHHRVEFSELNGFGMSASRRKAPEGSATIGVENNYTSKKSNVNHDTFDDLFIDFQAEMNGTRNNADIDLDKTYNAKYKWVWDYGDMLPEMEQCNYRIHFPIAVRHVYPVRTRSDGNKYPPDPLYARIESETILNSKYYHAPTGLTLNRSNMSSVRKIIININANNFDADNARPLIFFYDGPEKGTVNQSDNKPITGESVRQSKPVILNLYEDFRGILFAPNSPVVINGNGHKFESFVVGEYFTQLMPELSFELIELIKVSYEHVTATPVEGEGEPATTTSTSEFYLKKSELEALAASKGVAADKLTLADFSNIQAVSEGTLENLQTEPLDFYAKKTELNTLMNKKGISNQDELTADDLRDETDLPRYYKVTEESVVYSNNKTSPAALTVNTMFTDDHGNVQFTDTISASIELDDDGKPLDPSKEYQFKDDLTFDGNPFKLSSWKYNAFLLVGLVNYTYLDKKNSDGVRLSNDCFYTTDRSKHID